MAIKKILQNLKDKKNEQVLLGVTGSGKTFTMAKVIESANRPALVLAPNKTLAAQLYGEMKSFFPDNAVEYFVSYYDYYTPEAYVPRSDTYIEKEASINEQIDRMRHSATRSLLERDDVIIVASVSCIYGLGSVEAYSKMTLALKKNYEYERDEIIKTFVNLQYKRNDQNFFRGTFRVRGENLEIFPSHLEDRAWRLSLNGNKLEKIEEFDPLTGDKTNDFSVIYVAAHSNLAMPHIYTWVAFYAGNEGSLLFIATVLSVIIGIAIRFKGNTSQDVLPAITAVLMFVMTFFLAVIIFMADPFQKSNIPVLDGQGINPLLTHFGMFFHPPALMSGLICCSIPMAFSLGHLICGKSQDEVNKLIAGPSVYICNECVDLCNDIIEEESKVGEESSHDKTLSPAEIFSQLDEYVIGQQKAGHERGWRALFDTCCRLRSAG